MPLVRCLSAPAMPPSRVPHKRASSPGHCPSASAPLMCRQPLKRASSPGHCPSAPARCLAPLPISPALLLLSCTPQNDPGIPKSMGSSYVSKLDDFEAFVARAKYPALPLAFRGGGAATQGGWVIDLSSYTLKAPAPVASALKITVEPLHPQNTCTCSVCSVDRSGASAP